MVNAILAAVLSLFIPGLGQAVAGDIKKGVIFLIIAIILGGIASFVFQHWIVWLIDLVYAIYAAYDAYQMAQ